MTETEFHRNLSGAEILIRLSDDPSYLEGYCRGLRRYYYGEFFGTAEEHEAWMTLAGDAGNEQSRAKGEGYRQGLAGTPIVDILEKLAV
jgi:hypothetical protein